MSDLVFLLSSERSGSNLLRVMMDSHPCISAPHSPHLIKTFVPLLPQYGDLDDPSRLRQLAEDMRQVVTIQLRDWPYVPTTEQILERADAPSFPALLRALYGLAASHAGKARPFVKDNGAIPFASDLAVLFPDAKFVYLVRDARDVALSWKKSPGHPGGVGAAAKMWGQEQDQALHFLSLVQGRGLLHRVHYEDLVKNPAAQLDAICTHIGEEFDPQMLRFHEGREAQTSAEAAIGWSNLVKPVLQDNTGKYKQGLSSREQSRVERIAFRPLIQLGYLPEQPKSGTLFNGATFGRLWRAGRVAIQQLLRGPAGVKELKLRTKRLSGLREIMARQENSAPVWPRSDDRTDDESGRSK